MSDIEIVSASAGSGKTYELARILEEAVRLGEVKPENVVATTFTRRAAAELKERVRRRLLEAGMAEAAQRLNAAVMGTVNSVCGRFVTDFAFDLGLSPELRVLDEDASRAALNKALSEALEPEMDDSVVRLQTMFWKDWSVEALVRDVVDLARANGMGPEDLEGSRDRCLGELGHLMGEPCADADGMKKKLQDAIRRFLDECGKGGDTSKCTAAAVTGARQFLGDLRGGRSIPWQKWSAMAKLGAAKKSAEFAAPIEELAARHVDLPEFRRDIEAAVYTVFDLAAKALDTYRAYKDEHGLIDFIDQESLALELLGREAVRERLEGRFDLVLVDEFQDSSPIQLAIFLRLAGLARRSVWVGDQKQSIFGFRGSDPELMNAAIDTILGGKAPRTLGKSWRSRPELVRVTSELFGRAFPRHGIPSERVRLEPAKTGEPGGLGPVVERWYPRAGGRKKADKTAALAAGIRELLADEAVTVRDRKTGEARRAEARDVAVLCRTNKTAAMIAEGLAGGGIKSAVARAGLMKTPEARLMLAAIRLWADPGDGLSAAEMARILDAPDKPDQWLAKLLKTGAGGEQAFNDVPAIRAIREAGVEERRRLGVLAVFDRIMEIIELRDLCRRWGEAGERLANLNVLRSYAVEYVRRAAEEGAGMTPAGLAGFLSGMDDGESDERAYSPDADAVVVSTWHRAKGLEWPIVILYDLDWTWKRLVPGIHVATDRKRIEPDDPLAERWIRFWPHPYHPGTRTAYHERMEGHPAIEGAAAVERRESLRLLYVGWTRARDRVVIATPEGKLGEGMLSEMGEPGEMRGREGGEEKGGVEPLLSEPIIAEEGGADAARVEGSEANGTAGEPREKKKTKKPEGDTRDAEAAVPGRAEVYGKAVWAGVKLDIRIRRPEAGGGGTPVAAEVEPTYVADGPDESLAPAKAWPDLSAMTWTAGEPEVLGAPIRLKRWAGGQGEGDKTAGKAGFLDKFLGIESSTLQRERSQGGPAYRDVPGGSSGRRNTSHQGASGEGKGEEADETGLTISNGEVEVPTVVIPREPGDGEGAGGKLPYEMKHVGSAVHAFVAADDPAYEKGERLGMAAELLARWKAEDALDPSDLVEIADRLRRWAEAKWPKARWGRELPVRMRLESGSITDGVADLIIETDEGIVIVDHKSYPGGPENAKEYAVGDAGQVQVYADAAAAALGKPVLGMHIHLPLIGVALKLGGHHT